MKAELTKLVLGIGLMLGFAISGWATTPRQHAVRGFIASIDQNTHALILAPDNQGKPLPLVWNGSTRFKQRRSHICPSQLKTGASVRVSYRIEIGKLVLREVSLRSDVETPGPARDGCCAKRS